MQPAKKLDHVLTDDGKELSLWEKSGHFHIKIGREELMSSLAHGSEEAMARLACPRSGRPRVLIGGLGMGYTLRAALDQLGDEAVVTVAEIEPRVVEWNRAVLGHLAQHPLADRRVTVREGDVFGLLAPQRFEVILLDVDNGPDALSSSSNARLYGIAGLQRFHSALTAPGVLAIWSAAQDHAFVRRLKQAGFSPRCETVRARASGKGARHTIFLGHKTGDG